MSDPIPNDVRPPVQTAHRYLRWGIALSAGLGFVLAVGWAWFAFREQVSLPKFDTTNAHAELVKVLKEASEAVRGESAFRRGLGPTGYAPAGT